MFCIHLTPITLPQVLNYVSGSTVVEGMDIQDIIQTVSKQGFSEAQIRFSIPHSLPAK